MTVHQSGLTPLSPNVRLENYLGSLSYMWLFRCFRFEVDGARSAFLREPMHSVQRCPVNKPFRTQGFQAGRRSPQSNAIKLLIFPRPPSSAPTKIDLGEKKGTLLLTSLLEDLDSLCQSSDHCANEKGAQWTEARGEKL